MPRTLQRVGLAEALIDFGVDANQFNPLVADLAAPTIQLQDLTYNYEPALRCRGRVNMDLAAGGAGVFGGCSIRASQGGFWIVGLWSLQNFLHAWLDFDRWVVGPGTDLIWNLSGSSPGEVLPNSLAKPTFVSQSEQTAQAVGPDSGAIRFQPQQGNMAVVPWWVPANSYLNVVALTANQAVTAAIDIIFPANNPGRF